MPLRDTSLRHAEIPLVDPSIRAGWVDVAKAFCIVMIVMMHSTIGYQMSVGAVGFLDPVVAFVAPFRIPALFVLSGLYAASAMRQSAGAFLRRRIAPLAYFYGLWAAIQLLLKERSLLLSDPIAFASHAAMAVLEPYGTLWFIHVLALCSLALFAVRLVPRPIVVAGATLLYGLSLQTGWTAIDEFAGRFVFIVLGWAFTDIIHRYAEWSRAWPMRALAVLSLFTAGNVLLLFSPGRMDGPLVTLVLGACGTAALIAASVHVANRPLVGPLLAALGRRTLPIYLAFFLPMAAMREIILGLNFSTSALAVGAASVLITMVAVAIPLVLNAAAARTPLAFLFAMLARNRAASASSRSPVLTAPPPAFSHAAHQ